MTDHPSRPRRGVPGALPGPTSRPTGEDGDAARRAARPPTLSRRAAIAATLPLIGSLGNAPAFAVSTPSATVRIDVADPGSLPFDRRDAGIVGVYDIDWLRTPGFDRLLDNLAASPGAFSGVRVFGAFTAGRPERLRPEDGGNVWLSQDDPIDLSLPLDALAALTSRGLTPLVALGFFPPAVSPSPIRPPADWAAWRTLVRTFLETLAADPRFGPDAIAGWWFEVWNEPNEGRFWAGTQDDYHALYRATCEAVAETGLPVRLGGPAIAYKPQASPDDGLPWIRRFLEFVAADPTLRLDVLSLHRKGTVGEDPPDPRRLAAAAAEVATLALAIDPVRFAGLTIVNDEADEKVGFEVPYAPRMDAANAAWLAATAAIAASLTDRHRDAGIRFLMAADNANLQLVDAPFDGRRSIMTLATSPAWSSTHRVAGRSAGPELALEHSEGWPAPPRGVPWAAARASGPSSQTDLLKLPAYGFYEMLRLLGDDLLPVAAGADHLFPATDLYHLATAADTHVGILLAHYPDPGSADPTARVLDYVMSGLPWPSVNVALFVIDAAHSNAYTAAGGSPGNPFPIPDPADLPALRRAQELALACPVAHAVATADGIHRETLTIAPYATMCLWITPVSAALPAAPAWLSADPDGETVVVRWEPSTDPALLGYELYAMEGGAPADRLTPGPLRAALWVDTAPPAGRRYAVRAVTASGVAGPFTVAT